MKNLGLRRMSLASLVLSLGLTGCGGAGIEEGVPKDMTPGVKIDPKMTDMSSRSFKDEGKARATSTAAAKEAANAPPAEKKD